MYLQFVWISSALPFFNIHKLQTLFKQTKLLKSRQNNTDYMHSSTTKYVTTKDLKKYHMFHMLNSHCFLTTFFFWQSIFNFFFYPDLLQEQVLAGRFVTWIRASLWKIASEGLEFEITHTVWAGSEITENSHLNLDEDPRTGCNSKKNMFHVQVLVPNFTKSAKPKVSQCNLSLLLTLQQA